MFSLKTLSPLFAALLLFSPPAIHAEIASGDYTLAFDGDINLWDVSGTYHEDMPGGIGTLDYTMNSDPAGKLSGEGTAHFEDAGDYLDANFSFTGSIKSAGSVVRVSLSLKMSGT